MWIIRIDDFTDFKTTVVDRMEYLRGFGLNLQPIMTICNDVGRWNNCGQEADHNISFSSNIQILGTLGGSKQ